MTMPDRTGRLRRRNRIRSKHDFAVLLQQGQRTRSGPLRIHMRKSSSGCSRLGMAVSRRVGNAVQRNRIKRLIRAAFRSARHQCHEATDVVVVVNPHEPGQLSDYAQWLAAAFQSAAPRTERNP
ncbi:MAG: ribonuclease P protein component [Planctomycetes bacterium]|nr:ribonuclease P protein component [Planctomycetota bacterium]MCP4839879.1 ribonuclease P protein component [Planctomycetota bacterium]